MAETISLKKRLIGKEDINFDITGTNEQENFFTSDGGTRQLSKLNASHIPLLQETRGKLNAVNVDDALQILSDKVDNFEASDVLGEDLTISFLPEDDNETIQLKINQQKKNLNGHTLTFLFPSSLQQKLYTTFEWKDFFNGTVVISGGREDNRIAVYDNLDINSLFRIQRCQCEVIIRYFYFVHQHSSFAISAESSSAVIVDNCLFSGIAGVDSYAVNKSASNVMLLDCELAEDIEFYPPEKAPEKDGGIGKHLGEIFAYPGSVPPEGAYLLNGQTIYDCKSLYPKFWQWLTENAGEMVAVPVYKAWTMPALTADGTVGGAEYAVEASGAVLSGYDAYKSFDGTFGGAKTHAVLSSTKSGYLTYYSPKKLKLTKVSFQNPTASSATYLPVSFVISGSDDNTEWVELASGTYEDTAASAMQIVDIPASKYTVDNPGYQYLKFEFANGGAANTHMPEITLYCEEYLYTEYAGSGNILTLSNDAYEYTLARTGVCGGFVIDSTAGSVRLPTLVNGTLWGSDSSNIGQSLAAGLPNITGNVGFSGTESLQATGAFFDRNERWGSYAKGHDSGGSNPIAELDASRSNHIYGNSDTVQPPAIRVSWCIQVYNATTALSEQESAQLASEMQMKAQVDFANVNENLDFVVESWNDGAGNWYRKYRSGWIEQGGIQDGANQMNVTLLIEFADVNYRVRVTGRGESSRAYTLGVYNLTETGFSAYCGTGTNAGVSAAFSGELEWEAKGYAK